MPNYPKQLSIIILSYASIKYLEKCLISIDKKITKEVACEIIVVNNDEKADLAFLKTAFSDVIIINSGKNNGFGAGNNLGNKHARGKVLLFLNPDVELISNNVEKVLGQFEKDALVGVIGSKLISPNGEVQEWSCGKEVSIKELVKNKLNLSQNTKPWLKKEIARTDWVSGTALFIKKELFEKLGGFDENFFMYFEDMDLCARAKEIGFDTIYFPYFSVLHYGGKSYGDKKAQKKDYYDSQAYYFRKHRGIIQQVIVKTFRKILCR